MSLVPPYIASLRPYEAGRTIEDVRQQYGLTDIVKLASNENPLGASPMALEAVRHAMDHLNLYPNGGLDLRRVLAREFDLRVENVITGSGSEGIMSNIIRTFLGDEDEVLTTAAAFIGFQVLAKSRGVKYRTIPYRDWHYDLPALAAAITAQTKIIYLANPNNPTGTIFTRAEFDSSTGMCPSAFSSFWTKRITSMLATTPAIPIPCITAMTTSLRCEHFRKPMVWRECALDTVSRMKS